MSRREAQKKTSRAVIHFIFTSQDMKDTDSYSVSVFCWRGLSQAKYTVYFTRETTIKSIRGLVWWRRYVFVNYFFAAGGVGRGMLYVLIAHFGRVPKKTNK